MTCIEYEGARLDLEAGESVLEGLLRYGHDIPNGCRAGVCQACVMSVDEGELPTKAQQGLSDAQKSLNQFLSCQCAPDELIKISKISDTSTVTAEVLDKNWVNTQVLRLRLIAPLDYKPGQYVTLWKEKSLARCYSLASHPLEDDYLELHIKVIPDGAFSCWVAESLQAGDKLKLQGPLGSCIYTAIPEQPLFLSAIGTGLAPIYGILRDALNKGHGGLITLVMGAAQPHSLYLVNELQQLATKHSNLIVHFVTQSGKNDYCQQGDIYQFVQQLMPDLSGYRVFICGAETFVKKMRRQCFMAGANMKDISADVFVPFID